MSDVSDCNDIAELNFVVSKTEIDQTYPKIFAVLTSAQVCSNLSDRLLLVGLSWFIISKYSASTLSIYLTMSMLPHLFMAFFSAKIINYYSPLKVIKIAEFCRAVSIFALGLVLIILPKDLLIFGIMLMTTIANIFAAIFNPAIMTMPKQLNLNEHLYQRISALLNSSASIGRMVGPIISVPLYAYLNLNGLIFICFLLYFAAWIFELFIKKLDWVALIIQEKRSLLNQFMKIMTINKMVTILLMIFFIINLTVLPIQLFMPLYAKQVYYGHISSLATLESTLGLGLLLGAVFVFIKQLRWHIHLRIVIPYLIAAVSYLMFSLIDFSLIVAAIFLFFMGFFLSIGNVITISFYQYIIPRQYLANIMVMVNIISSASGPFAIVLVSILLKYISMTKLTLIYSLIFLLLTLGILFVKKENCYD